MYDLESPLHYYNYVNVMVSCHCKQADHKKIYISGNSLEYTKQKIHVSSKIGEKCMFSFYHYTYCTTDNPLHLFKKSLLREGPAFCPLAHSGKEVFSFSAVMWYSNNEKDAT